MSIPYEYCAYRFLELWERTEKRLHKGVSETPSAVQIREALNYFRVARTFKGLSDGHAEKISKELIEVSDRFEGSYSEKVIELASRFKKNFGLFNLSAASKLLWLRNRRSYLIYDSRAVTALHRLGNKFKNTDYTSYCEAWNGEYERRSDEISLAARGLVNLPRNYLPRKYTEAFFLTDDYLSDLVQSEWFLERVFDIYLWETGAAKSNNMVAIENA